MKQQALKLLAWQHSKRSPLLAYALSLDRGMTKIESRRRNDIFIRLLSTNRVVVFAYSLARHERQGIDSCRGLLRPAPRA